MQINRINQLNYNQNQKTNKLSFGNIVRNNIPQKVVQEKMPRLFIVSGPSGVGKDTVIDSFNKMYGYFTKVVTSTTRNPRPQEIDGIHYNFLSPEQFKNGIKNNEFLEYVNVFADKFYGTRKSDVENILKQGKNALLIIDVDGAKAIKEKNKDAVAIFIQPESLNTLKEHLEKRGTETPETLKTRLGRAEYEINAGQNPNVYDAVIQNNNNIEENVNDFAKLLGL